jgi:hypothetical protein
MGQTGHSHPVSCLDVAFLNLCVACVFMLVSICGHCVFMRVSICGDGGGTHIHLNVCLYMCTPVIITMHSYMCLLVLYVKHLSRVSLLGMFIFV